MTMMKQDSSGDGTAISLVWFVLLHCNHTLPKVCADIRTCVMILDQYSLLTLRHRGGNPKYTVYSSSPVLNTSFFPPLGSH